MNEAIVRAEECFMDMESLMKRIKKGEKGSQLRNDIRRLADSLNVLVDDLDDR